MCNMFKDHNLVAEALSRNPGELWEIFMQCVWIGQWTTSETNVHSLFCIGVNESLRFTL